MLVLGVGVRYRPVADGIVHCERCGGDRPYRRWSGRRFFHLLFVPVAPLDRTGEHVQCTICKTCYRVELLAVPTTGQMLTALAAGSRAAALAMLRAGNRASRPARRRAIQAIRSSGTPGYDDARLAADLGCCRPPGPAAARGRAAEAGPAVRALAVQLEAHAREWFLAEMVRIGLADGPLTDAERHAARRIAEHLGMTQAHAQDVIWLTEEAAPTG